MTPSSATLERPAAPVDERRRSRAATWWGQWRVALRLARRDAWRAKGRSLLVLILIALPVCAVAGVDIYARTSAAAQTPLAMSRMSMGATADAYIVTTGSGLPVQQGWSGAPIATLDAGKAGEDRPVPDAEAILSALPDGSRLADMGTAPQVILEHDGWGVVEQLMVQDVRDPLLAGLWRVREGRLPSQPTEIALSYADSRRLRAGIGDAVLVTPANTVDGPAVRLDVVGIADPFNGTGDWGVTVPGAYDGAGGGAFVAAVPGGLGWESVRELNQAGLLATSRAVLDAPPAFCRLGYLCLDTGEVPGSEYAFGDPSSISDEEKAQAAAAAAVISVIVVLQIALLAGPAFAVQLRRRQRELGLIGASGGNAATLRRTMLASGVVLGLVGAMAGVVVAWIVVLLLGGVLPFQPLADVSDLTLGVPVLPPELLGVVAVGVVAATAAALVPAVIAGRGDVIDSLQGRRKLPPVRRGVPLFGVVLGAAGLAVMAYGAGQDDGVVLGVGIIVGQLGVVVLMPALVSWFSLTARWMPLSGRLAVRDAGRHRMRTTAAACAIAAAAAVAVGAAGVSQTLALADAAAGRPYVEGTSVMFVGSDPASSSPEEHAARVNRVVSTAQAALPDASIAVTSDLVPEGALEQPYGGDVSCVSPETPGPGWDPQFPACDMTGSFYGAQLQLVEDPASLAMLLGPLAPVDEARAALEDGAVVVLARNAVDGEGRVTLSLNLYDETGTALPGTPVTVPAMVADAGVRPASFLVGPAAIAPGGALSGVVEPSILSSIVAVKPAQPDRADAPTGEDRLRIAFYKAGLSDIGVLEPRSSAPDQLVVFTIGAAVTAGLAVLVGLMVTALALVDGRAHLVTLAAVGGPPAVRRRMAAFSAGFVSLLGCVVGAVAGLLAVTVLIRVFSSGAQLLVMPWAMVAVVVLAVPLVTTAAAFLTTRSKVEMVRRLDS